MDQVRDTATTEQVEHLLHYLTLEWESVSEAAEEWAAWDDATRDTLRMDWPIVESKLERLRSYADQGFLNEEQRARYDELLKLIEKQRPVLESLMEDPPQ